MKIWQTIIILTIGHLSFSQESYHPAYPDSVNIRIMAMESGLSRRVHIAGENKERLTLEERMTYYKSPGVNLALINNNKIEWIKCYGIKDVGSKEPVTKETLFQAASISKPVSALAALKLVEDGLLDLDEPLNGKLKSWKIPENEFTEMGKPTLRNLLNHSAGFTNGSVGDYIPGQPKPTLLQALDGIPPSEKDPISINYVPGTKWRYSGGGYTVLQQLIEDVSNSTFSAFLHENVLKPVGMSHSFFQQPLSRELSGFAAKGHNSEGLVIEGGWTVLPEMAAGGIWTTANDLAQIIVDINRSYLGEQGKLLTTEMTHEMLQVYKGNYGLGFKLEGEGDSFSYSHTGSNQGYRSYFIGYPARRQGAVILTNADGGSDLRWEIMRSLSDIYDWPNFKQLVRNKIKVDTKDLDTYPGRYEFEYSSNWVLTVHVEGERIFARLNTDPDFEIFPESTTAFFSKANTLIVFHKEDTEIDYITVQLDGDSPSKWIKVE